MFPKIIIFILLTKGAKKCQAEIEKSLRTCPRCALMMNKGEKVGKWLDGIDREKQALSFKRIY